MTQKARIQSYFKLEDSDNNEEGSTMASHGQFTHTETQIMFNIDRNIVINSKALLNMIFENDTVSMATANMKTTRGPATGTSNQEKKISVAEAFENW